MIAIWFSQIHNINDDIRNNYVSDLKTFNKHVNLLLDDLEKQIDKNLYIFDGVTNCFILGKGNCEPIAKEGSLKVKEISYIHSEGYSTSSLKHGPFALLDKTFPVILIAPKDQYLTKNINAYNEIKSRYAPIIVINNNIVDDFNTTNSIFIPYNKTYNNLLTSIVLQMFAYKLSVNKGINPDLPKNLAKVVTVE